MAPRVKEAWSLQKRKEDLWTKDHRKEAREAVTFLMIASLIVLGIWAASALPIYQSSKVGGGDGFEAIPFVYASLTLLPLGAAALHGAWKAGRACGAHVTAC